MTNAGERRSSRHTGNAPLWTYRLSWCARGIAHTMKKTGKRARYRRRGRRKQAIKQGTERT